LKSPVNYGVQAADWSIGRVPDGSTNWVLTRPTPALGNIAASLGDPQALKINEWMADPLFGSDWFEVYNPNPAPVDLSGLHLSDNVSDPLKHVLPPLSFVGNAAYAFQKFEADESLEAGADHVSFKLSASGESLVLSTANGVLIDGISFGPQMTGISQGRLPDGGRTVVAFSRSASPGSSNYLPFVDNDGDGLADGWETANGLNPNDRADALADNDGDGFANLYEYLAGTNPRDEFDYLSLLAERSALAVAIRFQTVPGRSYTVEFSDDLRLGSWRTLATLPSTSVLSTAQVNDPISGPSRFYRLRVSWNR
jgi:hypothetical protein